MVLILRGVGCIVVGLMHCGGFDATQCIAMFYFKSPLPLSLSVVDGTYMSSIGGTCFRWAICMVVGGYTWKVG